MPGNSTNYYTLLGLNSDANTQQIKNAYKALALQLDPNKNPANSDHFAEVKEAYETLVNQESRAKYDCSCKEKKQESLTFPVLSAGAFEIPGSRALIPSTRIDLAKNLLEQDISQKGLIALGERDEIIAELICTNEALCKKASFLVLQLGITHEKIALKILNDQDLWSRYSYNSDGFHAIANKYQNACQIMLKNPLLSAILSSEHLIQLREKYGQIFVIEFTQDHIATRISSYFVLTQFLTISIPESISDAELTTHVVQCKSEKKLISDLAIKHLRIAKIIYADNTLHDHRESRFYYICLAHEYIALISLQEHSYQFTYQNYRLHEIVTKYPSAQSIILKHYPSYNQNQSSNSATPPTQKTTYSWRYYTLEEKDAAYHRLVSIFEQNRRLNNNTIQITTDLQNDLAIIIDSDRLIRKLGDNYESFTHLICNDLELAKRLYSFQFRYFGIKYESLACRLITEPHLLAMIILRECLFDFCNHHKRVCELALTRSPLCEKLSGQELSILADKHGITVRQQIEQIPALNKKIKAYILFNTAQKYLSQTVQRQELNQDIESYQHELFVLGNIYLEQKNISVSQYYYYNAVELGHRPSLEALDSITPSTDITYQMKMAVICANPKHKLYDVELAKLKVTLLEEKGSEEYILEILRDENLWNISSYRENELTLIAQQYKSVYLLILITPKLCQQLSGQQFITLNEQHKIKSNIPQEHQLNHIASVIQSEVSHDVKAVCAYHYLVNLCLKQPLISLIDNIPLLQLIISISGLEVDNIKTLGCRYLSIARAVYASEKLCLRFAEAVILFGFVHHELTALILSDEKLTVHLYEYLDYSMKYANHQTADMIIINKKISHLLTPAQEKIISAIMSHINPIISTDDRKTLFSRQKRLSPIIIRLYHSFKIHDNNNAFQCCLLVIAALKLDVPQVDINVSISNFIIKTNYFHPLVIAFIYAQHDDYLNAQRGLTNLRKYMALFH